MKEITIKPIVYVLELEDDCWYVGITYNLNMRWGQHIAGEGAKWTKLHKPVDISEVYINGDMELENTVTKEYIKLFGKEKVRGGKWCKI